jgi:hypothetical protein
MSGGTCQLAHRSALAIWLWHGRSKWNRKPEVRLEASGNLLTKLSRITLAAWTLNKIREAKNFGSDLLYAFELKQRHQYILSKARQLADNTYFDWAKTLFFEAVQNRMVYQLAMTITACDSVQMTGA